MGSIFSKALVYLGLVDEDPVDPDQRLTEDDPTSDRRPDNRRPPDNRGPDNRGSGRDHDDDELGGSESRRDQLRRVEPRRQEARRVESVSRVEGRRVEPPSSASRTTAFRSGHVDTSQARAMRPIEVQADILVVEEFGDAKILADRVRDRVPVVLDLRRTDPDLVRRVIDFGSGLIYAIDGTMSKVGEGVVVVLPPHVLLSRDERRRLERLGVYELPVDD
jgi:cell division inhibitor SepF